MNKNIILSFLFILAIGFTISASSQEKTNTTQADSLRKELNSKEGSDKISTQLELALRIMESDGSEALSLANSALSAAKTAKNKNLEMLALLALGRISDLMGNKDLAEIHYDSALTIAVASGDNWNKGEILFRKGVITYNRRDEIHALEYFNSSLDRKSVV